MAKDPAFLFYPGDYLRDTQVLSEKSQVAYDRIMCEHMRNICITQQQLNFFTKRLTDEEKEEISFVLDKIEGGYQITWVAESIVKRKEYSESRRKNRIKKPKNTSLSYDSHMENENENEEEDIKGDEKKEPVFNFRKSVIDLGVEKNVCDQWLKVRKAKKGVNTEIAFNKIKKEIEKSNLAANDCIKKAVEKSWAGYEWDWHNNEINKSNGKNQQNNEQPKRREFKIHRAN